MNDSRLQLIRELTRIGQSEPVNDAVRKAGLNSWPDWCAELIAEIDRLRSGKRR